MRSRYAAGTAILALCQALTILTSTARGDVSTRVQFPPPERHSQEGKTKLKIPGCDLLSRMGQPEVPFRVVKILIPPNSRVVRVQAEPLQPLAVIPGEWDFTPTRTNLVSQFSMESGSNQKPASTSASFPRASAELISVQRLLGHDIALVRVFPVRYSGQDASVHFSPTWQVTVSIVPLTADTSVGPQPISARSHARVRSYVDNPALLDASTAKKSVPAVDYLIITVRDLQEAFKLLLDHKTALGLRVKTACMEDILATQPGRDAAERLRNYLKHAWTNLGVEHVLLGGDVNCVPVRYAYLPQKLPERDCLVPADLYFACLDGSWNRDNDQRWAEPTDGEDGGEVDLLAELFVGRAPVDTPAETAAFVEKTIRASREENKRKTNQILLLSTFLEQASAQGGDILDELVPAFQTGFVRWLDDRPSTAPRWGKREVLRELNASPDLVLYSGHGQPEEAMRLKTAELAGLTNQQPFLFCSVACNAGQFDNDSFTVDCMAEQLVGKNRFGAFAAIVNSREGWYAQRDPKRFSGEYQRRFMEHLMNTNRSGLGEILTAGKHDLLGRVETTSPMPYRVCYFGLHLLGDPHQGTYLPDPRTTKVQ